MIFTVTGPIGGDIARVADRKQMKIRRVPYFIDNLERGGLLSRDPIRVNRIHDDKIASLAELAHDSKRIVKVPFNGYDFCAIRKSLQQFAARNLSAQAKLPRRKFLPSLHKQPRKQKYFQWKRR